MTEKEKKKAAGKTGSGETAQGGGKAAAEAGALIVAAGLSSRMGDFKPMLSLGSISIAQRIIATFHKAGIERIAVVTGYRAVELERHLAGCGIVFLRNEDYAHTEMFDSVRIGLDYLKDKCGKILFTPVDIPLFTAKTVRALLDADARLASPVCGGRTGHPILLGADLVPGILADDGRDGLRGALARSGVPMTAVPVDDPGILLDADTPKDYKALLACHNEQLLRPEVRVSLVREKPFLDEDIYMLFMLVEEYGSVRKACERMQMSYSKGWNTIRRLESQVDRPLIYRNQGGAGARRSGLTAFGRAYLAAYRAYADAVRERAGELFEAYFGDITGEQ